MTHAQAMQIVQEIGFLETQISLKGQLPTKLSPAREERAACPASSLVGEAQFVPGKWVPRQNLV